MEKFLHRLMALQPIQREKFLKGIAAGFWGKEPNKKIDISRLLMEWLKLVREKKWEIEAWPTHFEEFILRSPIGKISKGAINNLFIPLNQALDEALPILVHLLPKPEAITTIQQATYWLVMGEVARADALQPLARHKIVFTEEEIEAWYHFHRAYHNHLVLTGQSIKRRAELKAHFEQIHICADSLHTLRSLRLHCATLQIDNAPNPNFTWQPPDQVTLSKLIGERTIGAFQDCLTILAQPIDANTEATWLRVWGTIEDSKFPKDTHEFRELACCLLNVAIIQFNRGIARSAWMEHCLNLFDLAFEHKALYENGFLPAQHLINFCRMAIQADEPIRVKNAIARFSNDLSSTDLNNGEDKYCSAMFHFAMKDYSTAMRAINQYHPTEKRKLARYVLKTKIMVAANDDGLDANLEAFKQWLRGNKNSPSEYIYNAENERLKLVKRLVSIDTWNKNLQRRLWKDILNAVVDSEWLQAMFIQRFGKAPEIE
jgi:hypothetical protein